jgi:predicted phosphodiesterase
MKILAISDLHGILPTDLPEVDVICIAGDIIPLGIQRKMDESRDWFFDVFAKWIDTLQCKHVLIVAGNHDFFLEYEHSDTEIWKKFVIEFHDRNHKDVRWLFNEPTHIDGIKFFGTPWTNMFENAWRKGIWAFESERNDMAYYEKLFNSDADVIITHDSPQHNQALFIYTVTAKAHGSVWFHGHWHEDVNVPEKDIYNVSILNNGYVENGRPYTIIEVKGKEDVTGKD